MLAAVVDGFFPGALLVALRSFIALWIAAAFFGFLILLTWMACTLKQLPDWTDSLAWCAFGATCIASLSAAIMLIQQVAPCLSSREQGISQRSTASMSTQAKKEQEHAGNTSNIDLENGSLPSLESVEATATSPSMSTFWSRCMLESPWMTWMQTEIGVMWFSQSLVGDMSERRVPK